MGVSINSLLFALYFIVLCSHIAKAEDSYKLGGHLKYQPTLTFYEKDDLFAVLGKNETLSHYADARINTEKYFGNFDFVVQGQYLGLGKNADLIQKKDVPFRGFSFDSLGDDRKRFFDLSKVVNEDEHYVSIARLDRLSFGYTKKNLVLRLGRQVVSWGNGLAFQVLDPFNPFSPTEIDKDYKTGDDMVYVQWLFESGEDVQFLVVPRRSSETGDVQEEESSWAIKYKGDLERGFDYDLLLGRHYEDSLLGAGVSKDVMEAVWRLDILLTHVNGGGNEFSFVSNIDRSWVVFDTNIYGFMEYFYSGFGETGDYMGVSDELLARIERGELFSLAKNYLDVGGRVELTPILNFYVNNLWNLDDSSGVSQARFQYDIYQDVVILIGLNIPWGSRNTEFGGFSVGSREGEEIGEEVFVGPGESGYVRVGWYF